MKKNKIINLFGDTKTAQNKDVKYSELLEQFVVQFANEFADKEYVEDVFEFAINAWNYANITILLPQEEIGKSINIIQENVIDGELLQKMIDYKVSEFKDYTNFIIDFEFEETADGRRLTVVAQEGSAYISAMMDDIDKENSHADFEENYINRNAIIVKPLQPFFDWRNNLNLDNTIKEVDVSNIYLVSDEIDDLDAWLKKKFDKYFMLELEDWQLNRKKWPQKRSYKMFKQWFQVDVSMMIYDLEKKPVLKS